MRIFYEEGKRSLLVNAYLLTQLLPPEGGRLQTGYKPAEDLTYVSY